MHGFTEDEWMSYIEKALLAAGERMRTGVDTGMDRVARINSAVLARVRIESEAKRRIPVVQSIQVLRAHLGPMCGTESADRVIRLAARRSGPDVGELTGENWPAFVTHLGSILAAFCGASPARNIVGVARRLGMEDAA